MGEEGREAGRKEGSKEGVGRAKWKFGYQEKSWKWKTIIPKVSKEQAGANKHVLMWPQRSKAASGQEREILAEPATTGAGFTLQVRESTSGNTTTAEWRVLDI